MMKMNRAGSFLWIIAGASVWIVFDLIAGPSSEAMLLFHDRVFFRAMPDALALGLLIGSPVIDIGLLAVLICSSVKHFTRPRLFVTVAFGIILLGLAFIDAMAFHAIAIMFDHHPPP